MRKILCTSILTIGLMTAGSAFAAHDPLSGPGGHDGLHGNQGCDLADANGAVTPIKNPGKLLQLVRSALGQNPKQWTEFLNGATGRDNTNGEWIGVFCDDPEI